MGTDPLDPTLEEGAQILVGGQNFGLWGALGLGIHEGVPLEGAVQNPWEEGACEGEVVRGDKEEGWEGEGVSGAHGEEGVWVEVLGEGRGLGTWQERGWREQSDEIGTDCPALGVGARVGGVWCLVGGEGGRFVGVEGLPEGGHASREGACDPWDLGKLCVRV